MLKKLFCWIGWHSFLDGFERTNFDGASWHARCKWCSDAGMIDSQGNFFSVGGLTKRASDAGYCRCAEVAEMLVIGTSPICPACNRPRH